MGPEIWLEDGKLWRWMVTVAQHTVCLIGMNGTLKNGYNGQHYVCFTTMKNNF